MTIDDLVAFGANTSEGMKRCLNKEDFYLRMVKKVPADSNFQNLWMALNKENVKKVPADSNFQKLFDAIKTGDLNTAFEASHALKGVVGNLALSPLFTPDRRKGDNTGFHEALLVKPICAQHCTWQALARRLNTWHPQE